MIAAADFDKRKFETGRVGYNVQMAGFRSAFSAWEVAGLSWAAGSSLCCSQTS